MHRAAVWLFALAGLLVQFVAASAVAEDAPAPTFTGDIVIGATFPLSGELENYGQSAYYGANTRVRMVNAAGGVNGKRLVLEWRDNGSNPEQAVADIRELVEKHNVPAVLGPLLSDATMAARDVADELEVVILSPLASVDAASQDNPWVFRVGFSNTQIASGMIDFQMRSFGVKSCGILYDSRHTFSIELSQVFADTFTEHGGRVVGIHSIIDENGEKDYVTPLRALAEEKPDLIFAASYALEATEIVRTAGDLGIDIRLCGPDTWDNELVYDASGTRLVGTAVVSALFETAFNYRPFQTFYNAMEQAGMDFPDAQAASAYDAVSLLVVALEKGETSAQIREGLLAIRRLPLATGRVTMGPNGNVHKPVIIRIVERRNNRLLPVFAVRIDP
ncbi:MAG: ABC transporter substrate-binding protein [Planctomycetaceae bacterium]|nr:ABC transporter substrate-binding protein [Planctomycetaceae bacterium]